MSAVRKVLFFPSLAYNMVAEKLTSRKWYDRLDDYLILGALPFRSVVSSLKKHENLGGVISFNENYELNALWYSTKQEYEDGSVEFLQLPVADWTSVPSVEQVKAALEFVERVRNSGKTVYVHCKAGRFRSAYFAVAYIISTMKLDPESALEFVKKKRSQVWLGRREMDGLQQFYDELYTDK